MSQYNQEDLEKQNTDPSSHLDHQTAYDIHDHHSDPVSKIITSGANDEYIHIGRTKVLKSELLTAFGGTLQPGISAPPEHRFANPAPLGLSAFALTTFVLSLINVQAKSVSKPNIVVGLAFFYGGLIQLLAGMWEIALENTFGGTALSSYGGFWLAWGAIQVPWFGIGSAYGNDVVQLKNAAGFFLLGWVIFNFILLLCTFKSTVAFFSLFFFLEITFILLAAGDLTQRVGVTKAGGVFGVITAFIAWYNAFAGLATKENSYFTAYAIPLPGSKRVLAKGK